jgi:hypothetical protein
MTLPPTKFPSRRRQAAPGPAEQLPYAVELWTLTRTEPERVLGRAEKLAVAEQLFEAALLEHPARLVVLRDGERILRHSR